MELFKGQLLYYAQIIPKADIYEVHDVTVRSIYDNSFTCINNRDRYVHLFSMDDIDKHVFTNRDDALEVVRKEEKNGENKD